MNRVVLALMGRKCRFATLAILMSALISLTLGPVLGCAQAHLDTAVPMVIVIPDHVRIDQISSEYKLDPTLADQKYKGKRLIFDSVEVEEVHSIYYQSGGAITVPMIDYFRAGSVRFELLDYRGAQQRVQVGFILTLDGVCQGAQGNLVNIIDCGVTSIKGDLGIGLPPAIGY
jgi:hypothetical protein